MKESEELTQRNKEKESTDYLPSTVSHPPQNKVKIKPISPRKIGVFWDTSDLPQKIIQLYFGLQFDELVSVIRIYDVTDIVFSGKNAHSFYELSIPYQKGYWFVKGLNGGRNYLAEIGVYLNETEFFPFYRSECIHVSVDECPFADHTTDEWRNVKQAQHIAPNWHDYVSTYSFYSSREDTHD
ncbi:DUF4912 domain-containing protein [Neobacillus dielmonensis]|uniref:DUF4912 domain-containing protein n=1 Tax=Neobacillus dielmonensis TaxID=1347369 RepID=UPI001F3B39A2|nr:DUF4912 domain-containing protein [Neobacillus dielmonensis]